MGSCWKLRIRRQINAIHNGAKAFLDSCHFKYIVLQFHEIILSNLFSLKNFKHHMKSTLEHEKVIYLLSNVFLMCSDDLIVIHILKVFV